MEWLSITIQGEPETWGLGKTPQSGKSALKVWQEKAGWAWRQVHRNRQLSGPVELEILFRLNGCRKDWTNLAKGLEDGLKQVAFGDDVLVYKATVTKEPATDKGGAYAVLRVRPYSGPVFKQHLGPGSPRSRARQLAVDVPEAAGSSGGEKAPA